MKVILLQDVARLGRKYDVKEVSDGHAQNLLIPRGLAKAASADNLKQIDSLKAKIAADGEAQMATFLAALEKAEAGAIMHEAVANEIGHLFKGIKVDDIAGIVNAAGVAFTPAQILQANPIKEVGEHTIAVAFGEKRGSFVLNIVAK